MFGYESIIERRLSEDLDRAKDASIHLRMSGKSNGECDAFFYIALELAGIQYELSTICSHAVSIMCILPIWGLLSLLLRIKGV